MFAYSTLDRSLFDSIIISFTSPHGVKPENMAQIFNLLIFCNKTNVFNPDKIISRLDYIYRRR